MIEAVEAGQWARDLAYYLRRHPCALELRIRVKNLTKGHGLTEDDLDQLTRKTRWLLFGARGFGRTASRLASRPLWSWPLKWERLRP
jgi:hypothetical protein